MLNWKKLRKSKPRTFLQARGKGYLLIEAVASIAVIAIGLTVILRSFASSFRASKISQEYFTASSLLKDRMWELEEKARREGGGIGDSDAIKGEKKEISNTTYELNIDIKKIEDPYALANVKSVVSWDNGSRHGEMEVATFLRYKEAP